MKDHIINETILKTNGFLDRCMYCSDPFGPEDNWKVEPYWQSSYITVTCSCCKRENRLKDNAIHTLEDLLARMKK